MTDLQPALGSDRDAPAGLTVGRMVRMLARQWFVIPICVIVAVGGSVAYSKLAPRHYQAFVGVSLGVAPPSGGGQNTVVVATPTLPSPDAEVLSASVVRAVSEAAHVSPQDISLSISYGATAAGGSMSGPTGEAAIAATATTALAAEEAAAAAGPAFVAQRTTDLRGEVTTQIQQLDEVQKRLNDLQSGKPTTGPIGSLTYNPTGPLSTQISVVNSLYQSLYGSTIQLQVLASSVGVTHSVTAAQLVGISTTKRAAEAAAAGLLVGIGLVLLRDRMMDRATDPFEIRGLGELPVLGSLPNLRSRVAAGGAYTADNPIAESYRAIRTAVTLQIPSRPHVLLVVSSDRGDGRTSVAVNLAAAFAYTGTSTLLVDADFRHPAASDRLGVSDEREGLADLLRRSQTNLHEDALANDLEPPDDAFVDSGITNLAILPPGRIGRDSPELLSGEALEKIDWILRQRFELIVVDTPAMMDASDAVALAPRADSLVFVFARNHTRKREVTRALALLHHTPIRVLGTVITNKGRVHRPRGSKQNPANRSQGSAKRSLAHSGRRRRRLQG